MDINRNAPVVAAREIIIRAPIETVWQLHTQIGAWPEWNPEIARAELNGPLAAGTTFDWETAGLAITSTLQEVIPRERLAWSGVANGILGIHVWTFTPSAEGVLVRTEESWEGAGLTSPNPDVQRALDDSLVRWLSLLKAAAEAGS